MLENRLKFDLVGQTSNVFFHADYNPSIVISTIKVNKYVLEGDVLSCDCGTNVAKLSREMLAAGYDGFSGLIGLPGTVAGSVYGNAGCFKCSINAMLLDVDMLMADGTVQVLKKEDLGISHRSSALKRNEISGIILTVRLKITKTDNIEEELSNSLNYRIQKSKARKALLVSWQYLFRPQNAQKFSQQGSQRFGQAF